MCCRWVPYRFSSQQNFCYFFAPDKCVDSLCGSIDLAYGIDNPSGCYTYAIDETIGACVYGAIPRCSITVA